MNDRIDAAIDEIVDLAFRKGIQRCHSLWHGDEDALFEESRLGRQIDQKKAALRALIAEADERRALEQTIRFQVERIVSGAFIETEGKWKGFGIVESDALIKLWDALDAAHGRGDATTEASDAVRR